MKKPARMTKVIRVQCEMNKFCRRPEALEHNRFTVYWKGNVTKSENAAKIKHNLDFPWVCLQETQRNAKMSRRSRDILGRRCFRLQKRRPEATTYANVAKTKRQRRFYVTLAYRDGYECANAAKCFFLPALDSHAAARTSLRRQMDPAT
jgi:hypothetical protein